MKNAVKWVSVEPVAKRIFAVASVIIFLAVLGGCPQPNMGIPGKAKLGSISGIARFSSGENHAGITITLEETDGLRSLAVVSAAQSIASGNDAARSLGQARLIQAQTSTADNGKYSFANVAPGFYTVYASSPGSQERAVAANVQVTAGMLDVTAPDLNLTPVGFISGQIRLDNKSYGNFGFLISIAGTSYMAVTDDSGNFTINDIPAAENAYYILIMKGNYAAFWNSEPLSVRGGEETIMGIKQLKGEEIIDSFISIGSNGNWFINGVDTGVPAQGPKGEPGKDGTPGSVVTIGPDGYWYIDGNKTNVKAEGAPGTPGTVITIGADGYWYIDGNKTNTKVTGEKGADGASGSIVTIGPDGFWYIDGNKTNVKAEGAPGTPGTPGSVVTIGTDGYWYINGSKTDVMAEGTPGTSGSVITIGTDGYWYIDGIKTDTKAEGKDGTPGSVVTIGDNGNWYIDGVDTGIKAQGPQGEPGKDGSIVTIGANGNWYIDGNDTGIKAQGEPGADGQDGHSPVITIIDGFWHIDGVSTGVSAIGQKGADGHTPVITIVGGFWYVDGVSTGVSAIGQKGDDGHTPVITIVGGFWYVDGVSTGVSAIGQKGDDGHTPVITIVGGFWCVDGVSTGVSAIGQKGDDGHTPVITIVDGFWFVDGVTTGVSAIGQKGADGKDGLTPHIGANGNWWLGSDDTGVKAQGPQGETPYIGSNGNWWVGSTDTGVKAQGDPGDSNFILDHITASSKKEYAVGEAFSTSDLEILAHFTNGMAALVTFGYSLSWNGQPLNNGNTVITSSMGEKIITVTWEGKNTNCTITVMSTITVKNTSDWNNALSQISSGANDQTYTVNVNGNVGVPGTTTNSFGNVTGLTITIKGTGKLYLTSRGSIVKLANNQTLYLDGGIILEGLKNGQNGASQDNDTSVVFVSGGSLTMQGSASVSGNNGSFTLGGGVRVDNGTFTMRDNSSIHNNVSINQTGGGVFIQSNGTFTMQDSASVYGNTADGQGGGVSTAGGKFTMKGSASIYNNTTYSQGGGIYALDPTLKGQQVTIQDYASIYSNTSSGKGGGVCIYGTTFTMLDDSSIYDNTASGMGGGVAISDYGAFIMQDNASVHGNTTSSMYGGGVFVQGTYNSRFFRISGGIVYGNSSGAMSNTAANGAAMYRESGGTAQYGIFSGETFTPNGDLYSTNDTIEVVNGQLVQVNVSNFIVTANGSSTQTTTQLTLTFSQAINGLTADDITLSGVSGVTKGTLSGSGPTYTLPISGFTTGGTLTVAVTKSGYTISNSPGTVLIYYVIPVTFSSVTADGSATQTTTQLVLTFNQAIAGLTADDITLSGISGVTKGTLSGLGPSYTLPISGFGTGGTLTVAVAKSGYMIGNSPITVSIYYTIPVTFSSVTANGSSTQITTLLTLTFNQAIAGLAADDITLSGVSGVIKGTLNGSGPTYTLPISDFSTGGTLTVAVAKSGYTINNSPGTVTIMYYYPPIDMVYVPGGSFQMGKLLGTGGFVDVTPVHTVTLNGFYICKYQVTQEQYQAVMWNNPSLFLSNPTAGEVQGKRPVDSASWYDAILFCNRLSIMEGLSPAYKINGSTDPGDWGTPPMGNDPNWNAVEIVSGSTGYRLPTEAQWEYAAKGGNGAPGNFTYSGSNNIDIVAWNDNNSNNMTHEVGLKQANGLGIYDMSGNVFEWCWDWYGSYTSEAKTNPTGAVSGTQKVQRGGSFFSMYAMVSSVFRWDVAPFFYGVSGESGFRVARPQ